MVFINEWMPNPPGSDTGEWVEIYNSGTASADISGWKLRTSSGKEYALSGSIAAKSYLVIPRSKSKLVLRNSEETLYLYDAKGSQVDSSSFPGTAPEGKSYSRNGEEFYFSEPSLGSANPIPAERANLIQKEYPSNVPLHSQLGFWHIAGLDALFALLIALCVILAIKKDDALSKLFFGSD
jgi:hypothetical protein